jgi:hypothetical protein
MTLGEAMAFIEKREAAMNAPMTATQDHRVLAARAAGLPDNPDLNKLTPAQNILFGLKLKRSSRS